MANNYEEMLKQLRMIGEDSNYTIYEGNCGINQYKLSRHVYNSLRYMRIHCICPETSRDIISNEIAPKFKTDPPGEMAQNRILAEIRK